MKWVFGVYAFAVGAVMASFIGVVADRLPRGISIAKGRSLCLACGHPLSVGDLIPVFGWIVLRGRCRYCGVRLSARYPILEGLGGGIGILCLLRFFGDWGRMAVAFAAMMALLCIAVIDLDTMEIPDALLLALGVPAVLSAFLDPRVGLTARVIGVFAVSLPMFLLTLAIPDCFGGGDVKLMAVCGFLLGWKQVLLAGFFALVTGGGYAAFLLMRRLADRKSHFAFGPFLAFGTALSLVCGDRALAWYLGLFS